MSNHLSRFTWIIILSCALAAVSSAGARPDKMASVRIKTLSMYRPSVAGQGEIHTHLTRWFESQGVKVSDTAEWVVWFNALNIDESDTNHIILAIGLGHTLPKEAIEMGKKSEIFYSHLPVSKKSSLPAEGKFIREYVTEGFLYEFMYPLDEKLAVVPRQKLLERLDELVNDLCARQLEG
ncbi:MAG: hypothetical protein NTU47_14545 [Ignavibacteriales bacterium]|nr:hypothetical protein [Ignavibacteriales bacterium]